MKTKNSTYLILAVILLILSIFGGFFLFQNFKSKQSSYSSDSVPKIEMIPTDSVSPSDEVVSESNNSTFSAQPTLSAATESGSKATISKTPINTVTPAKPADSVVSSSGLTEYSNAEDGFSVSYSPKRQLFQGVESSGNRYTFSLNTGDFAIHTSNSEKWSWSHPDRQFTNNFLISGKPTFRYDIATQTIVDLQSGNKNYTIQCVHNGVESLKTECETFIASFKLL